ncbi:MAG TPA: GTPase [Phycisphaerales bacterium]|nr:GTPase [Phycisphaerales bacterium]
MTPGRVDAVWSLLTPPGTGAVAIVQLHGDIDGALQACGLARVRVGQIALRDLMGVDRGLVARVRADVCQLMPHGGVAVVRELCRLLVDRGVREEASPDPRVLYPEARSEVEARALAVLARAASPWAVDLLLAQHALWAEAGTASDPERDRVLRRLIDPPLVVAFGASNIGKSTLVNALAGRGVSIVADEPGTTRDHVGVMLDLGGVVVRYVDTPGVRAGAGAVEREALANAVELAVGADLLLWCGDAGSGLVELPLPLAGLPRVTVALREDMGRAGFEAEARVSAARGEGLPELAGVVRERLVPRELVERRQAWQFW